jgi:hypothetical protein
MIKYNISHSSDKKWINVKNARNGSTGNQQTNQRMYESPSFQKKRFPLSERRFPLTSFYLRIKKDNGLRMHSGQELTAELETTSESVSLTYIPF